MLKEGKKRDKYRDLARELKKSIEHEGNSDTNCNRCTRNNPQTIGKGTRRIINKRTSEEHSDESIIKIGLNTEKSPGD